MTELAIREGYGAAVPRLNYVAAALIAGLGLALRIWGLEGQSATMDEVHEFNLSRLPLTEILRARDGFPPLYHVLLKGWLGVFGPEAGRWLSVLFGVTTILVAGLLGRLVGGAATGWITASLVAISPLHVWYAQEARANVVFYLLAVLGVWLFFRAMETNRWAAWIWYALVAAVGLYVHYFFTLVAVGLLATVPLTPGCRSRLGRLFATHVLLAAAALPWVWLLMPDLRLQTGYAAPHVTLDLKALGYTLVTFLFGFSVGPSLRELHVSQSSGTVLQALPWALAAGITCALLVRPLLARSDPRHWAFRLLVVMGLPILTCGLAAGVFNLGYRIRYVAWGASVLLALIALGLTRAGRSTTSAVVGAVLVVLSLLSTLNRHTNSRYANEDVRGTAAHIIAHVPPTEPVFVVSGYMAGTLQHYLPGKHRLHGLPNLAPNVSSAQAAASLRQGVAPGQRFWLVYSRPWDGDPDGRLLETLQGRAELQWTAEWPGVQLYAGRGW